MKELNLIDLYNLRRRYIKESYCQEMMDEINEAIHQKEAIFETSATGGLAVGGAGVVSTGMLTPGLGPVSSSQPSMFAGSTIDPAFSAGGGQSGSGDIGMPLNTGPMGVYQKTPAGMTQQHGPRGSSKNRREKKLDMKTLRNIFAKKVQSESEPTTRTSRVMNFDDFAKDQFTKIQKIKY